MCLAAASGALAQTIGSVTFVFQCEIQPWTGYCNVKGTYCLAKYNCAIDMGLFASKHTKYWKVNMKNMFYIFLFILAAGPLAGHSEELECKKGSQAMANDYTRALSLIQGGEHLTDEQERDVVHSLELAVASQCQQAALVLAEIRINQAAALSKGASQRTVDDFDDKIHALLLEAGKIGEGRFQLGSFYLTSGSKYFAPEKGLHILEAAAHAGDEQATEFLANIYQNGIAGVNPDSSKAHYWKAKLK
jgi:hypothetical protein